MSPPTEMESLAELMRINAENMRIIEEIKQLHNNFDVNSYLSHIELVTCTKLFDLSPSKLNYLLLNHYHVKEVYRLEKIYASLSDMNLDDDTRFIVKFQGMDLFLHLDKKIENYTKYIEYTKEIKSNIKGAAKYKKAEEKNDKYMMKEYERYNSNKVDEYFSMPVLEEVILTSKKQQLCLVVEQLSISIDNNIKKVCEDNNYKYFNHNSKDIIILRGIYDTYDKHRFNLESYLDKFAYGLKREDDINAIYNIKLLPVQRKNMNKYILVQLYKGRDAMFTTDNVVEIVKKPELYGRPVQLSPEEKRNIAIDFIKNTRPETNLSTTQYYDDYIKSIDNNDSKIVSSNIFGPLVTKIYENDGIKTKRVGAKRLYYYTSSSVSSP